MNHPPSITLTAAARAQTTRSAPAPAPSPRREPPVLLRIELDLARRLLKDPEARKAVDTAIRVGAPVVDLTGPGGHTVRVALAAFAPAGRTLLPPLAVPRNREERRAAWRKARRQRTAA